jgi:4-hydroxybenzoate polyprenyltransferase
MLALVQFIVSQYFVQDYNFLHYLLICTSTVLLALGGYLLNDVQDIPIDEINNKLKSINPSNKDTWTIVSFSLFALGLILGFWASLISQVYFFIFFVLAALSLIVYAYFLSKWKFIGNLLISFLIALAIILCFYLEVNHLDFNRKFYGFNELDMLLYAAIAFLLNWLREIVKDIEDLPGDKKMKRFSIPILIGTNASAFIVGIVLLFFICIFSYLALEIAPLNLEKIYLLGLVFNALIVLGVLFRAKKTKDYHTTSALLKLLMFLGLLMPLFS